MAKCPILSGQYMCGPSDFIQLSTTNTQGNTIFSLKTPSSESISYIIDGKPHTIKNGQLEIKYVGSFLSIPVNVIGSFTQSDEDGVTLSSNTESPRDASLA